MSLHNMCRTCMNDDTDCKMYSVFSSENVFQKTFAEMIMICFGVKVDEDDGLPPLICQKCWKQLMISYSFKQQIERCEATLKEITKYPDIEFIKEEMPEMYNDEDDIFKTDYREYEETAINETSKIKSEVAGFPLTTEFLDDSVIVDVNDELEQKYSSNTAFKSSVKENEPTRNFVTCKQCDINFKSVMELRNHKKHHARIYRCDICARVFKSAHGLAYHLKIHKGIKNYVCHHENCNRKFTLKQALQKHLSIHSKEKNHLCSLCGKTYSTYDALHYHLKAHNGERPYLCMHCGKTFKQSCHLKTHMWIHNGIKPHACKKCGKCYTSGHQLKKHLRKYCSNIADVPEPTKNLILIST